MRAAWYSKFGPASEVVEVGELEAPQPDPEEVLVRVRASGVNPVDVKRRAGGRGEMTSPRVIPHFDGAGIIERVGAEVEAGRVGQRVWLYEAQWQRDDGTAAELVAVPQSLAVPLPDGTSFEQGACLGIPALTAHRCVFGDGPVTGTTVLVTGGAGAVGHYAVQFAALGGAIVIATVSGEAKAELARAAGADHVVNYRREDVVERVRELTGAGAVDRIVEVEFGGNLAASLPLLRVGGVIATYASEAAPRPAIPFYELLYKNATVRFEVVFHMPESAKRQAVEDIGAWLAAGKLRHHIAETLPLGQAADAHRKVESGIFGKIVLTLPPA